MHPTRPHPPTVLGLPPRLRETALLLVALGSAPAAAAPTQESQRGSASFRTVEQAPGVTLALRPREARFDDGNSALITTPDGILVVDAPMDESVARAWISAARDQERTIRWVVNTHWHADHNQTNSLLLDASPSAEVVGHRTLLRDVPNRAAAEHGARIERLEEQLPAAKAALEEGRGLSGRELDEEQIEAQRGAIAAGERWLEENRDVEFAAPTLAYEEALRLELGELNIEILHFRAHTDGDTVVVIPERDLAFTGDLLDELPYVGHGAPRSWIEALDAVERLPVSTYVPGHGDPFGKEHLRAIRSFLEAVVAVVETAQAEGATLEDTVAGAAEHPELSRWRSRLATDAAAERFFDGTIADALRAAWNE